MKEYLLPLGGLILPLLLTALFQDSIWLITVMPWLTGVVCRKEKQLEGAIVSSAKAAALDDALTEIHLREATESRAELQQLPIESLEGIGLKYGRKLRAEGIENLEDLLHSMPDDISAMAGVSLEEAQHWTSIARFSWLKTVSEEDAEAIVYGGGITDLEELAKANPGKLLKDIQTSVKLNHVTIPEGYEFTSEMVRKWIDEANDLISD